MYCSEGRYEKVFRSHPIRIAGILFCSGLLGLIGLLALAPEFTPLPTHAAPLNDAPLEPEDPAFLAFDPNTGIVALGSLQSEGIYEQYLTVTTRTNSPQGYSLYLTTADENTCLRHEDHMDDATYEASTPCDEVPNDYKFTAGNPNDSMQNNVWGYSVNDGLTYITPQPANSDPASPSVSTRIKTTTAATDELGNPTTITFGLRKGGHHDPLANGDYSGQLTLSVLANIPSMPSISSVSPTSGVAGMPLIINGSNFSTAYGVTIGGVACENIVITSNTRIDCVVPVGTPGTAVDVEVTTWGGVATKTTGFTYSPAPTFSSISPNAYPTRHVVTLSKFTPAVTIATGGGSVAYATAVWFDLDADGQRAEDGWEDCTSFTASASSISCTAPPVLDANVTTTKAYAVCFTVFGISAPVCGANAFTYYYDTTPPAVTVSNLSTTLQTSNNSFSSATEIPISMTLTKAGTVYNYSISMPYSSTDADNGGITRTGVTNTCKVIATGNNCSTSPFPDIGVYDVVYTATDLAGNTAEVTKTYIAYKEYEYLLAAGETKPFDIAELNLGTANSPKNMQFGVWGGGGGGGAVYGSTSSQIASSSGGGGGGFAGTSSLTLSSFPATFTANTIGSAGSGGSVQGANGGNGGSSSGSYLDYTYSATGGTGGKVGTNNGIDLTLGVSGGTGSVTAGSPGGAVTGTGGSGGNATILLITSSFSGAGGGARGGQDASSANTCVSGYNPGAGGTGTMSNIFVTSVRAGCAGRAGRVSLYWRLYPAGY
ncbi:MAG: IPT/TIG domain-containing protein [Oscillospiraceae bacterium]|jgi:hypothetical protein|nr:IPT/TIG domain-containing protein [Oscillospiraceae bacterium]